MRVICLKDVRLLGEDLEYVLAFHHSGQAGLRIGKKIGGKS